MRRGLDRLRAHGLPIVVKTPLTSINESELEEIVALAEGWNVPHLLDATLTPRDDGDPAPLAFRASRGPESRSSTASSRSRAVSRRRPGRPAASTAASAGSPWPWTPRATSSPASSGGSSRSATCATHRCGTCGPARPCARRGRPACDRRQRGHALPRGEALARFPFCPALAAQRTGEALTPDEGHETQAGIVDRLRPPDR